MKHIAFTMSLLLMATINIMAEKDHPYKGSFYNKDNDIRIVIDLYDTTVVAPAYAFLGRMHGYMTGRLHDVWFITDCTLKNSKAYVKFTNDLGADSQDVIFTLTEERNLRYNARGANVIRRAEHGHWVKLPVEMLFIRRELSEPATPLSKKQTK